MTDELRKARENAFVILSQILSDSPDQVTKDYTLPAYELLFQKLYGNNSQNPQEAS